jgi:hypothetical protein
MRLRAGLAAVFGVIVASMPVAAQTPSPEQAANIATQAKRPTPKMADGKPDLNGTWDHVDGIAFVRPVDQGGGSLCLIGCGRAGGAGARAGGAAPAAAPAPAAVAPAPNFPRYKPELLAKVKELSAEQVKMDTVLQCKPPGVPRIGPPRKIVQTRRELVFLYDDVSGSFFRIVPIGGKHREDLPESYLGDAVGRWEGDTLVVETVNFNEDTWLTDNGAFHTAQLKVIERFRRVGDTIEYQAIVHDPDVLVEPWAVRPQTLWLTDVELEEPVPCDDRDLAHMVDKTFHANPR